LERGLSVRCPPISAYILTKATAAQIYLASDLKDGTTVGIKLETPPHRFLRREAAFYKCLEGSEGFAPVIWFGEAGKYNALVMKLHGPDLESVFQRKNECSPERLVAKYAVHMVSL
jgi:predicted Ser/Thr protein kinase